MAHAAHVVGVDGARGGWLAVWRESLSTNALCWARYASPDALLIAHRHAAVIAVDVPIGLPDSGRRECEALVRQRIGPRRSSVFPAPVRGILDATSQADASRRHRAIDRRGFGVQGFAILPHIRAWDQALRTDADAAKRVHEVHPEACFAHLNDDVPLPFAKKRPQGAALRRALLARVFDAGAIDAVCATIPRSDAAPDDVLDALAALYTEQRIQAGVALALPDTPCIDGAGLRMVIRV